MDNDAPPQAGSAWNAIMQYAFLRIFANDGRLDAAELAMLERLATADGVVDERERRTLSNILARADAGATDEMRESIAAFRQRYAID
jgi:uncharacterized tellurite resistance protein B-like protein